eukprot:1137619-Pelagomonas_calceolata.AAC.5
MALCGYRQWLFVVIDDGSLWSQTVALCGHRKWLFVATDSGSLLNVLSGHRHWLRAVVLFAAPCPSCSRGSCRDGGHHELAGVDGHCLGGIVRLVDAHQPVCQLEHVVAQADDDELRGKHDKRVRLMHPSLVKLPPVGPPAQNMLLRRLMMMNCVGSVTRKSG